MGMANSEAHGHRQANTGYKISMDTMHLPVGKPTDVDFMILNAEDQHVTAFRDTHERPVHFIVVNRDLSSFQHLHPEYFRQVGLFTVRGLVLPKAGVYRAFAEFTEDSSHPGHAMSGLAHSELIAGDHSSVQDEPIGEELPFYDVAEGYRVRMARIPIVAGDPTTLGFRVERAGQPVADLEPYLGALGHAVIISEGELHFIHAHPMESANAEPGTVLFHTVLPKPGAYKVFLQFQHARQVLTAPFVVRAA
jgi:hypothetical protein